MPDRLSVYRRRTRLSRRSLEAQEQWTIHPGDEYALDAIRKLAGIAVQAMEIHGIVLREPFEI